MCVFQIYSSLSSPTENCWFWVEYFKLRAKVLEHRRATLSCRSQRLRSTEASNPNRRLCMTVTACLKLYGNSRNSKEGGAVAQWLSEVQNFCGWGKKQKEGRECFPGVWTQFSKKDLCQMICVCSLRESWASEVVGFERNIIWVLGTY